MKEGCFHISLTKEIAKDLLKYKEEVSGCVQRGNVTILPSFMGNFIGYIYSSDEDDCYDLMIVPFCRKEAISEKIGDGLNSKSFISIK